MWMELCGLSGWGWDEAKGVPIASEEVMEAYFKAHPEAMKFHDTPPAFLNLLQELFEGVLATGSHARSIDEVIESCIDPELLSAVASQASGLGDEEAEGEEDEEEADEASELESARSSIEGRQSSSPSTERPSPPSTPRSSSSTLSRPSSLAIRKRALEQAAREVKSIVKRQRGRRRVADTRGDGREGDERDEGYKRVDYPEVFSREGLCRIYPRVQSPRSYRATSCFTSFYRVGKNPINPYRYDTRDYIPSSGKFSWTFRICTPHTPI